MGSDLAGLMQRYQKAETYMDNQDIPITEREKYLSRAQELLKQLNEATKNMSYEEVEELYEKTKS